LHKFTIKYLFYSGGAVDPWTYGTNRPALNALKQLHKQIDEPTYPHICVCTHQQCTVQVRASRQVTLCALCKTAKAVPVRT